MSISFATQKTFYKRLTYNGFKLGGISIKQIIFKRGYLQRMKARGKNILFKVQQVENAGIF